MRRTSARCEGAGRREGADLRRPVELDQTFSDLSLGLVDGVVMSMAEKIGARPSQRWTSVTSGRSN